MTTSAEFKLVVVDDSAIYRKLIAETLVAKQYTTFLASNVREAFELVKLHRPEVVITDWEMPDATGLELCAKIRSEGDRFTHIILLTSNAAKTQVIEGLASGADDYLTKPFHPGELLARVAVGRRIAELHRQIQLQNDLLQELATTDTLTNLPNRRGFEAWATRELRGALRYGFDFWAVMADLDRFKEINDAYGHAAGDFVLKRFAEILKANTRASNICARIGGEEFIIILTHAGKQDTLTAVDRIRRQLEQEIFLFDGKRFNITASFGMSGVQGKAQVELDDLVRQADQALYKAKRGGRNRIEVAPIL